MFQLEGVSKLRNLSLDYFHLPEGRQYHIYRIGDSVVSQQPHSHDFYQICYVARGHIHHLTGSTVATLSAGEAFVVPPGFEHCLDFSQPGCQVYSLSFHDRLFHPGFPQSNVYRFMTALADGVRLKVTPSPEQAQTLQQLMEALCREQESNYPDRLSAAPSLIASVLCLLSQSYFTENSGSLEDIDRCDLQIRECITYIDEHFTAELTPEQLTKQFALSRSRLSLLFPQYTGMTLKRYIAKKRIDYAVMLLRTTTFSVAQIARLIGYEDLSTFYRNFTRITGLQPTHYRPANKEERS